ncbi:hypothetical protein [Thermodesulfatator autotrophicus]|uniref:Uncharacterized protein n=1 Tax=Thermodesulfatator autotrophicus TaxID=1795632 RepID=A0A177E6B4_9BACT|nr:hypothetical protein [Thermodesulfatator autotrophicus]OAG26762.1 hypothetical protein TH606_10590 [Thermodesulfatator autotrophicus]
MRKFLKICWGVTTFLLLWLVSPVLAVEWDSGRLDIQSLTQLNYLNIEGDSSRSVNTEGAHYNEELVFNLYQYTPGGWHLETHLYSRFTDDPMFQINKRNFYILEGFFRFYNDKMVIQGGDFAEDFTRYTFNTSLFGVKCQMNLQDSIEAKAFVGRNRDEDLDKYVRYVEGASFKGKVKNLSFQIAMVSSNVDSSTLREDSPIGDEENTVGGISFEWSPLEVFRLRGEWARSVYNQDTRLTEDRYDNVYFLGMELSPLTYLNLKFEFERVEPWFMTVFGASNPDRQRYHFEGNLSPSPSWNLNLMYEYAYDKISSNSEAEERTYTEIASLASFWNPFWTREDVWNTLGINLQIDYFQNYNHGSQPMTDNEEIRGNFSLSQSFSFWRYSLSYTYSRYWDYVDPTSEYFSHVPALSLVFFQSKETWSYDLSLDLSYSYRKTVRTDFKDRSWRGEVNTSFISEARGTSLGLRFGLERNLSDNPGGVSDNTLYSYSLTLEQRLRETPSFNARLNFSFTHNDYQEKDSPGDYQEDLLVLKLHMNF